MNSDRAHNIRQVQLPSGKVIEVMLFPQGHRDLAPPPRETPAPAPQPSHPGHDEQDLHTCPRCGGDLVYPVDWAEAGPENWEVTLRCPDCEWCETAVHSQATVERFDVELDRGAEVLLHDLQQLAHANMAEDIDRFVDALQRDLIVPADF